VYHLYNRDRVDLTLDGIIRAAMHWRRRHNARPAAAG
jgi:hypothetical protein